MNLLKASDAELATEELKLEKKVNVLGLERAKVQRERLVLQRQISEIVSAREMRRKIASASDEEKAALAQVLASQGFDASGAVGVPGGK